MSIYELYKLVHGHICQEFYYLRFFSLLVLCTQVNMMFVMLL
jgi:hypothetical protein